MIAIFHVFLSREVTKAFKKRFRNWQSDAEVRNIYLYILLNIYTHLVKIYFFLENASVIASLREWIKYVEFHSSSPTRNIDEI